MSVFSFRMCVSVSINVRNHFLFLKRLFFEKFGEILSSFIEGYNIKDLERQL